MESKENRRRERHASPAYGASFMFTYVVAKKVKALPFRPFFEAIDDPSVRDLRSCLHVLERA